MKNQFWKNAEKLLNKGVKRFYTGGNDPSLAQAWIENMIKEMNLNFHPDIRAEEYINRNTHEPNFSKCEAKKLNQSINELFRLFGEDVYRISLLAIGLEA